MPGPFYYTPQYGAYYMPPPPPEMHNDNGLEGEPEERQRQQGREVKDEQVEEEGGGEGVLENVEDSGMTFSSPNSVKGQHQQQNVSTSTSAKPATARNRSE